MIIKKPIMSEKAVKIIETENTVMFFVGLGAGKEDIKKEIEKMFKVKVEKVRTQIRKNKKIAFVKLKKENPAIDIATKLGMM